MQLYIQDRSESTVATIGDFYEDMHKTLTSTGTGSYEFTVSKSEPGQEFLNVGNYVVLLDEQNKGHQFTITKVDQLHDEKTVYAEDASLQLLSKEARPWAKLAKAQPASYYFNKALKGTGWVIGVNQIAKLTRTLEWTGWDTVLTRLLSIATEFDNAELDFHVELDRTNVVRKVVDIYKQVGAYRDDIQLVYGDTANDIQKTESTENFATAIEGIGSLVENTKEGEPEKHYNFSAISYDDGDFYSPKGDPKLYSRKAHEKWDGKYGYSERHFEYETKDPQELLNRSKTELKKRCEPEVNYEISIADGRLIDINKGDTVKIFDHTYNPELLLQARAVEVDKSYTDPSQNKAIFGNFLTLISNVDPRLLEIQKQISQLPKARTPYPWVRYADDDKGTGMSMFPAGKSYMATVWSYETAVPSDNPIDYAGKWLKVKGEDGQDGSNGVPGPKGADGQTSYFHTAWADDLSGSIGFTTSGGDGKEYIGTYSDLTKADSEDPSKYNWALFKGTDGKNGYTPIKGADYFDGKDGQDGKSSYLWIRYSANSDGTDMTSDPTGAKYVGYATTQTNSEPTLASAYKWQLVAGKDGIAGEKGTDGKTSFLHIRYSNDGGKTFTANSGETVGTYIGQYTDFTQSDSNNVSDYKWALIKGDSGDRGLQGLQGPKGTQGIEGPKGLDGKSSYTHIAYATSSTGDGFSQTPTATTTYVGMYVDSTATDSTDPSKYKWTLIKGADGSDGTPGKPGTDGKTPYLHTAYSWSSDGKDRFIVAYPGENILPNSSDFGAGWLLSKKPVVVDGIKVQGGNVAVVPENGSGGNALTCDFSTTLSGGTSLNSSFLARTDTAGAKLHTELWGGGGIIDQPLTTEWVRYTRTGPLNSAHPTLYFWGVGAGKIYVALPKLSTGDVSIWTPAPSEDPVNAYPKFIGTYTDYTADDSTDPSKYTWAKLRGEQGQKGGTGKDGVAGKDGVGIKSTTVTYQASTSGTTQPTGTWSATVPNTSKGKYLWTRTVWTYTDKTSETGYSVSYIAKDGNDGTNGVAGKDGVGIKSTTITYASSTSGTTPPVANLVREDGWTADNGGTIAVTKHKFYAGAHTLYTLMNNKVSEVFASPPDLIKLSPNTTYTLKFIGFASSNVNGMDIWILGKSSDGNASQNIMVVHNRKLSPSEAEVVTATFTTDNVTTSGQLRFDNNGSSNAPTDASLYFTEVQIVEGTTAGQYEVVSPTDSTWSSTPPAISPGQFIWTKTVWSYTDGTNETGYSVGKIGDTGPKGDSGADGKPGSKDVPVTTVSAAQPATAKDGDIWWVLNSADVATAMKVYTSGAWVDKKVDQSVLNIVTLNAVTINGSTINGSEFNTSYTGVLADGQQGSSQQTLDKNGYSQTSTIPWFGGPIVTRSEITNTGGIAMGWSNQSKYNPSKPWDNIEGKIYLDPINLCIRFAPTGLPGNYFLDFQDAYQNRGSATYLNGWGSWNADYSLKVIRQGRMVTVWGYIKHNNSATITPFAQVPAWARPEQGILISAVTFNSKVGNPIASALVMNADTGKIGFNSGGQKGGYVCFSTTYVGGDV